MRNPFASPLWRNQAFVRVWTCGHDLDLRVARHPHRAAACRDPRPRVGRDRGGDPAQPRPGRDARLRAGRRRLGGSACVDARSSSGRISAERRCSAPSRSRSRSGSLTFWQLLIVSGLAAILTTFFDSADNAYLPTIVERDQLVPANSALAASGSAAEFMAFGISGFLVQALTAPDRDPARRPQLPRLGRPAGFDPARGGAASAARGSRARPGRDPRRSATRHPRPGAAGVRRCPDGAGCAVGRLRRDLLPVRPR